jgi:hypothetical protein
MVSGAGNLQAEVAGTNGLAEGDRSGSTARDQRGAVT